MIAAQRRRLVVVGGFLESRRGNAVATGKR